MDPPAQNRVIVAGHIVLLSMAALSADSPSAQSVYALQCRVHDPSLVESAAVISAILAHGLSATITLGDGQCVAYVLAHR